MRVWPLILAACLASPLPAFAVPHKPSTPTSQMLAQYHIVRAVFWHAEGKLQDRIETREDYRTVYLPLPAGDPLRKEYSRVATAVDQYLKIADENKLAVSPAMIYLGGLAKYSLGDNTGAPVLLERLNEFPDYRRSRYEGDDPRWAVPAAPAVSKLLFYCRLQTALAKADSGDAFGKLKRLTEEALLSLHLQREFAVLVASQSDQYNRYEFDEASFGGGLFNGQPCQARAGALPSTLMLVEQAWGNLLPLAVKADAKGVRQWLQALARPGSLLETTATYQLGRLTALLAAQLKRDINTALSAKQYDLAKTLLTQLRREYSDDPQLIAFADEGIDKVTLGYKTQGEATFDLNHFKPQTEALANFRKMLEVAPTPLLKGYAHFRIADALGTMQKYTEGIEHLKQAIAIWRTLKPEEIPAKTPDVAGPRTTGAAPLYYIEDATYYLGFYTGVGLKQRAAGIALQLQFVTAYPQSKWAIEALWDCLLWSRWSGHAKEEIAFAHELIEKRPHSVRSDNARSLLKELEN